MSSLILDTCEYNAFLVRKIVDVEVDFIKFYDPRMTVKVFLCLRHELTYVEYKSLLLTFYFLKDFVGEHVRRHFRHRFHFKLKFAGDYFLMFGVSLKQTVRELLKCE